MDTLALNWSWEILHRLAPDICQSAGSILAVLNVLSAHLSQWRTWDSSHCAGSVGMFSLSCSFLNWLHTTHLRKASSFREPFSQDLAHRVTVSRSLAAAAVVVVSVSSSDCSSSPSSCFSKEGVKFKISTWVFSRFKDIHYVDLFHPSRFHLVDSILVYMHNVLLQL